MLLLCKSGKKVNCTAKSSTHSLLPTTLINSEWTDQKKNENLIDEMRASEMSAVLCCSALFFLGKKDVRKGARKCASQSASITWKCMFVTTRESIKMSYFFGAASKKMWRRSEWAWEVLCAKERLIAFKHELQLSQFATQDDYEGDRLAMFPCVCDTGKMDFHMIFRCMQERKYNDSQAADVNHEWVYFSLFAQCLSCTHWRDCLKS